MILRLTQLIRFTGSRNEIKPNPERVLTKQHANIKKDRLVILSFFAAALLACILYTLFAG